MPPAGFLHFARPSSHGEGAMEIQWRQDVDAAMAEAKAAGKHVLLDFNAAPM